MMNNKQVYITPQMIKTKTTPNALNGFMLLLMIVFFKNVSEIYSEVTILAHLEG